MLSEFLTIFYLAQRGLPVEAEVELDVEDLVVQRQHLLASERLELCAERVQLLLQVGVLLVVAGPGEAGGKFFFILFTQNK